MIIMLPLADVVLCWSAGVLVVLGLGTAARLVLECWHERVIRRNIQRMEEEPNFEDFPPEHVNNILDTPTDPPEVYILLSI